MPLEPSSPPPARRHARGIAAAGARLLAPVACLALALLLTAGPQLARGYGVPLQTAVDSSPAGGHFEDVALAHIRAAGALFTRLTVNWGEIAPASRPAGFDPNNPLDPAYNWAVLDGTVQRAVSTGMTPIFGVVGAPSWGEAPPGSGEERPDPAQLAQFAHALAARYDGSHPGLPWVRYFEVWNEPNLSYFLKPQIEGGQDVSVETYRTMVNDFAGAVHSVQADDEVIAGALFPNGLRRSEASAVAPMRFTRELLCLSAGPRPRRVCGAQVHADVWSLHPYTSGGPSTPPASAENLWIDNMGALTKLVKAAQRLGTLVANQPIQTWVTEFSWDSNPPDPQGVPARLEQRWVAETLYRAWQGGYSVFAWYALRDTPIEVSPQQAGLYFACAGGIECDTPKPVEQAFRFPFVAFHQHRRRVTLWGRTPAGAIGTVQIQWYTGGRWTPFLTLPTDGDGIFSAARRLPAGANPRNALLRAAMGSDASPSFSLYHPPDILVKPFGS